MGGAAAGGAAGGTAGGVVGGVVGGAAGGAAGGVAVGGADGRVPVAGSSAMREMGLEPIRDVIPRVFKTLVAACFTTPATCAYPTMKPVT